MFSSLRILFDNSLRFKFKFKLSEQTLYLKAYKCQRILNMYLKKWKKSSYSITFFCFINYEHILQYISCNLKILQNKCEENISKVCTFYLIRNFNKKYKHDNFKHFHMYSTIMSPLTKKYTRHSQILSEKSPRLIKIYTLVCSGPLRSINILKLS